MVIDQAKCFAHDPGGKVKTRLPEGIQGDAEFSECGVHRYALRRWVGQSHHTRSVHMIGMNPTRSVLMIGMNPSTADASANDPTITREWNFTLREGSSYLAKCNLSSYRATNPKDLPTWQNDEFGARNLLKIGAMADKSSIIIVCWGKVPQQLKAAERAVIAMLSAHRYDLWCFGLNKDKSPKHPLYLAANTPLVRFDPN